MSIYATITHMLNRIVFEIKRVWTWLIGKRAEIKHLTYKDAFMAGVVLEIMQSSTAPTNKTIPLYSIDPIHPVDNRENTIQATKSREEILQQHRQRILRTGTMTKELMAGLLPSLTYIRVVQSNDDRYFCFEGNGRIAALKRVFSESDNLSVEVDLFTPRNAKRTMKKLHHLRKMHKMV